MQCGWRQILAVMMALLALGFGVQAKEEKKEEGESKTTPTPTPPPQPGQPLDGYYDLKVLRASARTGHYHYEINDLMQIINTGYPWKILLSCSVEFGSPSGPAEMGEEEPAVREELQMIIGGYKPGELLLSAGKNRLKEEIIAALNRRLKTARVRQVYWTDLRIAR